MATSLRISAWNANGLKHHVQEIILFLKINKIDILLVSESHTTEHTFVKMPIIPSATQTFPVEQLTLDLQLLSNLL
jgi:exonuclease III